MGSLAVNHHWPHSRSGHSVLVTGAAGFLGSWTVKEFASRGAHVVGLDIAWTDEAKGTAPDSVAIVDGDVRDSKTLTDVLGDFEISEVIHLAAQTLVGPAFEDPLDTFEHNIRGTWSVLDACRGLGQLKALVIASSDKAYGDIGGDPYDEEMPLRPAHPYDVSKACSELIAGTYAKSYGQPVVISRCGNLYGGGDLNWSRIVPGTIRAVLDSERPVIRSDGTYVRDYLYVEDAARAMVALTDAAVERPELHGEAFNFAAGVRLSVLEIAVKILKLMGSDLKLDIRNEAAHEIPQQRLRADKARELLDWEPDFSLDEGLERTICWYTDHLSS